MDFGHTHPFASSGGGAIKLASTDAILPEGEAVMPAVEFGHVFEMGSEAIVTPVDHSNQHGVARDSTPTPTALVALEMSAGFDIGSVDFETAPSDFGQEHVPQPASLFPILISEKVQPLTTHNALGQPAPLEAPKNPTQLAPAFEHPSVIKQPFISEQPTVALPSPVAAQAALAWVNDSDAEPIQNLEAPVLKDAIGMGERDRENRQLGTEGKPAQSIAAPLIESRNPEVFESPSKRAETDNALSKNAHEFPLEAEIQPSVQLKDAAFFASNSEPQLTYRSLQEALSEDVPVAQIEARKSKADSQDTRPIQNRDHAQMPILLHPDAEPDNVELKPSMDVPRSAFDRAGAPYAPAVSPSHIDKTPSFLTNPLPITPASAVPRDAKVEDRKENQLPQSTEKAVQPTTTPEGLDLSKATAGAENVPFRADSVQQPNRNTGEFQAQEPKAEDLLQVSPVAPVQFTTGGTFIESQSKEGFDFITSPPPVGQQNKIENVPVSNLVGLDQKAMPQPVQETVQIDPIFQERGELEMPKSDARPVELPLATPANSLNRTQAPLLAAQVAPQISAFISQQASGAVDIALAPEELGKIRVSLTPQDNGLAISILAERPETLDHLRRQMDQLLSEFKALGYEEIDLKFGDGAWPSGSQKAPPEHSPIDFEEVSETQTLPLNTVVHHVSTGVDIRL